MAEPRSKSPDSISIADASQPGGRPSLADSAYAQLRGEILGVELWPGATFSEADLVARLGLGKTPVREALLRLRLEGLVEVRPRAGYQVAPATLKGTRDSLELRGALDAEAAVRAAGRPGAADELGDLNRQLLNQPGASVGERVDDDRRFHLALAAASRNEALVRALDRSFTEYTRLAHLAAAIDAGSLPPAPDHSNLVAAIEKGDAQLAAELCRAEVAEVELRIVRALIASDSIVTTNVLPAPATNKFYLDIPAAPEEPKGERR